MHDNHNYMNDNLIEKSEYYTPINIKKLPIPDISFIKKTNNQFDNNKISPLSKVGLSIINSNGTTIDENNNYYSNKKKINENYRIYKPKTNTVQIMSKENILNGYNSYRSIIPKNLNINNSMINSRGLSPNLENNFSINHNNADLNNPSNPGNIVINHSLNRKISLKNKMLAKNNIKKKSNTLEKSVNNSNLFNSCSVLDNSEMKSNFNTDLTASNSISPKINFTNFSKINNSIVLPKTNKSKITLSRNLNLNFLEKAITNENKQLDSYVNFLCDIPDDGAFLISHLKIIEASLDIELVYENYLINNGLIIDINYSKNCNKNTLILMLKRYFNVLKKELTVSNKIENKTNDEFFIFHNINKLYSKLIKLKIIIYGIIMLCYTQMSSDVNLKTQLKRIYSSYFGLFINFFDLFIYQQLSMNYPDIILNLKQDFSTKYSKIYKNYKVNKEARLSDTVFILIKNSDGILLMIKQFSNANFKYSSLKTFHTVLFDILKGFENRSINEVANIFLNCVLFCILNKSLNILKNEENSDINNNNNYYVLPYLPPIDNYYQYTLVLDLDETLIHYFYVSIIIIYLNSDTT